MHANIQVPTFEQGWLAVPPRRWEADEEVGLGMMAERKSLRKPIQKTSPICFERWCVEEGDTVHPGKVVAELNIHGHVTEVMSFSHGIVAGLVGFMAHDIVHSGDLLLTLNPPQERVVKGKGLRPRPSMAMRILRGLAPNIK